MNQLYSMLMGGNMQMPQQQTVRQPAMNPFQRTNAIMQAMRNPQAFVQQMIPGLPPEIANDPNRILQYMREHMGVTDEQIRQAAGSVPRW